MLIKQNRDQFTLYFTQGIMSTTGKSNNEHSSHKIFSLSLVDCRTKTEGIVKLTTRYNLPDNDNKERARVSIDILLLVIVEGPWTWSRFLVLTNRDAASGD